MAVAHPLDSLDPVYQAQFRQIQRDFVAGLPRRLQQIRAASDTQELQMALHRLAGAAGGYGFDELGLLARAAMQAADAPQPAQDQALQALQACADTIGARFS